MMLVHHFTLLRNFRCNIPPEGDHRLNRSLRGPETVLEDETIAESGGDISVARGIETQATANRRHRILAALETAGAARGDGSVASHRQAETAKHRDGVLGV